MGDSNRDKPPSDEPSIGDLLKSDEFQAKLEAARARRAQVQAERAKSGRPSKLRPIRPGTQTQKQDPEPMVLGTADRVAEGNSSAEVIPLTSGMRIVEARPEPSATAAASEPSRARADTAPLAAPARAHRKSSSSLGRTLATSVAGIVVGFAAGAIVMDLAGREIGFSLPSVFESEAPEAGAIRSTRSFEVMVEPPVMPDPATTAEPGRLVAASPVLEVPQAPPNGTGAERPEFAADPPAAPFAEQAADSSVVLFAGDAASIEEVTRRLGALGMAEIDTRPVAIGMEGTVVRFYREEDAAVAEGLAGFLDASVQDLTSFRPRPEEPKIEVWIGSG